MATDRGGPLQRDGELSGWRDLLSDAIWEAVYRGASLHEITEVVEATLVEVRDLSRQDPLPLP